MGVIAYLDQAFMTPEKLDLMPIDDQNYYLNLPAWVTGAFALAVFCGTFGCIALLLRKKIAVPILIISFIAVLVQLNYNLLIQNYKAITGELLIMPILVIIVAAFLVFYSNRLKNRGVLNK